MQPIIFNSSHSGFDQYLVAVALKATYLLADNPVITGSLINEIYLRRTLNELPLNRKVDMMLSMYKHHEEWCNALKNTYATLKHTSKVKHKQKELLAAQKKTEQMLKLGWEGLITEMESRIDKFGFGTVRELEPDQVFQYLFTNLNSEDETGDDIKVSELLQLLQVSDDNTENTVHDDNNPQLFCLFNEFFSESFPKETFCAATEEEARLPHAIYLQRCFTLPYINLLSAASLRKVHSGLTAARAAFRAVVDDWCNRCYNREDAGERVSFFANNVLAASNALQDAVEEDKTLQHCHKQQGDQPEIEIWMGEIPVTQLWQFYRHF